MKILVVYDSYFGNTERIALAIKDSISEKNHVSIKKVTEVVDRDLVGVELIVIGSPTRAYRPTEAISKFLKKTDASKYKWIIYDTGVSEDLAKSRILKSMINKFGYASTSMEKKILKAGGVILTKPETFFVVGNEGPLVKGEINRFQKWFETVEL